ncbi:MAG TPA: hypothetical protein V6D29_01160 [Leptolyngbyaceae cyanobacterium]
MTASPETPNSDSAKSDSLKGLIAKGMVGAIALTGTTAIPLLVQRFLAPPAPVPAQSLPTTQQVTAPMPSVTTVQPSSQDQSNYQEEGKGAKEHQAGEKGDKGKGKKD